MQKYGAGREVMFPQRAGNQPLQRVSTRMENAWLAIDMDCVSLSALKL